MCNSCKNYSILIKVVITLILTYSAFMILFMSIFDLLSMSTSVSLITFIIEQIIPNISAVIALIFLIRYLWTTDKNSNLSEKNLLKGTITNDGHGHKDSTVGERKLIWNEENRLLAEEDNVFVSRDCCTQAIKTHDLLWVGQPCL